MTTPVDTIKSAILGVPADPNKKPSRNGVVQAFTELYNMSASKSLFTTFEQFGAIGNGSTDDSTAYTQAKTYANANGSVCLLPDKAYFLGSTSIKLDSLTFSPMGYNARIRGNIDLSSDINTNAPFTVEFRAPGYTFDYKVIPRPERDALPIKVFPAPRPRTWVSESKAADMLSLSMSWPSGDTWSADTASFSAGTATWNLTTGNVLRAAFVPAWGFASGRALPRDVSWSWFGVGPTNAHIGAALKCSNGWVIIQCDGDASTIGVYIKAVGGSVTTVTIPQWAGRGNLESWLPRAQTWAIRPTGPYEFDLILGGVVIYRGSTAAVGWIQDIGPAAMAASAPATISASSISFEESPRATASIAASLLVIGDSLSDTVASVDSPSRLPVQWPHFALAHLDGAFGDRVTKFQSIAKAGDAAANQHTALVDFIAAGNAAGVTDAVIFIGANDIQSRQTGTKAELEATIDLLQGLGIRVTLVSPHEFYSRERAEAVTGQVGANLGQPVTVYQSGAPYRALIRQVAGIKGVGYVDGARAIGLEIPEWLGGTSTPRRLFDNIHGDALFAAQLGQAIASEILTQWHPEAPTMARMVVPAAMMAGTFTSVSGSLSISVVGNTVRMQGYVARGATAWNGSTIMNIPRFLRPANGYRVPVLDGANALGALEIRNTSEVVMYHTSSDANLRFTAEWVIEG